MSIAQPTDAPAASNSAAGRSAGTGSRQPANAKRGKRHYGIHVFLMVLAIM